jgi:spermidine/putrescine transport system ATP-binding protein
LFGPPASSTISAIEAPLKLPPDLVVKDVTKSFAGVLAVDRLSLQIEHGEFYSLLGPSGCGKTTSLRLVGGFEFPDHGSIQLGATDVTRLPPNKRRVNTVFQQYALFPHLTVEENVGYGLRHDRLSKAAAQERLSAALSRVRLEALKDRYPRQLSGGQRQRVALARALVKEPTVLLLDEPLAALDLKLRKAMQHELKDLQQRLGITFLYVTHDQEEALTLSDRIAVMNDGRLLQEGSPREIYERPRSRFVADFIGQSNFLEGIVEKTGETVLVRVASGGGSCVLRCASGPDVPAGMHVTVAVRPERIRPLGPPGGPVPANVLTCQVVATTYLGDLVVHRLKFGAVELTAQQQAVDAAQTGWQPGASVSVGWDEDAALVLADDPMPDPAERPRRMQLAAD